LIKSKLLKPKTNKPVKVLKAGQKNSTLEKTKPKQGKRKNKKKTKNKKTEKEKYLST